MHTSSILYGFIAINICYILYSIKCSKLVKFIWDMYEEIDDFFNSYIAD